MLKTFALFACLSLPTTALADGSAKAPPPPAKKDPPPPPPKPAPDASKQPPKKPKPDSWMSQENATNKTSPKPTDKKK